MSRTHKDSPHARNSRPRRGRSRDITVRAVRRDPPDLKKLSRALIQLALDDAAAERTDHENGPTPPADHKDTADD